MFSYSLAIVRKMKEAVSDVRITYTELIAVLLSNEADDPRFIT